MSARDFKAICGSCPWRGFLSLRSMDGTYPQFVECPRCGFRDARIVELAALPVGDEHTGGGT